MAPIPRPAFATACVQNAVFLGVNPHYLAAVAQFRSQIDDGSVPPKIGPYRLVQAEFDQSRNDNEFEYDYEANDINHWRSESAVFAVMTLRTQTRLLGNLNRYPSVMELYAAQFSNDPAPAVNDLQAALDNTAPLIAPAADALLQQPWVPPPISTNPNDPIPEPPTPKKGTGGTPAVDPAAPGGQLGELIARGEGKYTSFNRGNAGGGGNIDFTQMTIAAVMAQQALPKGNPNRLFAVGKYQLIPSTMKAAVAKLGIDTQGMLTHAVQESLFRKYLVAIKRPAVKAFVTGAGSLASAQMSLALEFASVARPDTGRSNYEGTGGNHASITAAETATRLQQEHDKWNTLTQGGMSAEQAWIALSPGIGA